MESDNTLFLM